MNRSTGIDAQAASPSSSIRRAATPKAGGWDEKAFPDAAAEEENVEIEEALLDESEEQSHALAVCLVSGGMDSCVTAAIAREENDELAFLHLSYGQRTEARERRAFDELADHYGVDRRLVVNLESLARIGGSSLTDTSIPVAEANLASQEIPASYVPFRNAHLLSTAVSWAEVLGAQRIYIGAVADDSSGYPDCRPEFYAAFQYAVDVGTRPDTLVEIRTPVINLRKSEIVRRGRELDAPLALTWSCYAAEDLACGRCDSCALRLRAFREAGVADPIAYA
jgi:7-cyano-7-deazaguanine synthase